MVDSTGKKPADKPDNLFKVFFNAINDAIFIHPLQKKGFGKFTEVNDIACRRYGYTREEFMDLTATDITLKQDVKTHARPGFRKKLASEGKLIIQTFHIKKNGEVFPVEINSNIIDRNGKAYILAVVRDISERVKARELLERNLAEKETLLKELFHRTKNNMQIICSMIELECTKKRPEIVYSILKQIERKILTMAMVHQKLYEAQDLFLLNMQTYLHDLILMFQQNTLMGRKNIKIECIADNVTATIDTAIPVGLIVNELLTNAIKHAFPDNKPGKISLHLSKTGKNSLYLKICDNGRGFPRTFDPEKDGRLGLETVFTLSKDQLEGSVAFSCKKGCCWEITIPESKLNKDKEFSYKPNVPS